MNAKKMIAESARGARAGFRWFGPDQDVPIMMIAQIPGVTDVVSALHHIPPGDEWTIAEIVQRKIDIEFTDKIEKPSTVEKAALDEYYMEKYRFLIKEGHRTGLVWSTIESLPFTEDIKNGGAERDRHIANYQKSLSNLGVVQRLLEEPQLAGKNPQAFAFLTVMGNFMLVADWTRTGYVILADGSRALEFNHTHFMAFDIFMTQRHRHADGTPDLEAYRQDGSYTPTEIETAQVYWNDVLKNDRLQKEKIANMIVAGLPGAQASLGPDASLEEKLKIFREAVLKYKGMTVEQLRGNIDYFLARVVPFAKAAKVVLCCHPDDPSYSPFLGTPRAVGDVDGYKFLLDRGCGAGICFGSMMPNEKNCDCMQMIRELIEYGLAKGMTIRDIFPFVHLRPIASSGKDFREDQHAAHVEKLGQIVYALSSYGWDGVFRPDHAPEPSVLHDLVTRATGNEKMLGNRGYSVPGRAMGASLLIGIFHSARQEMARQESAVDALIRERVISAEMRDDILAKVRDSMFEATRNRFCK